RSNQKMRNRQHDASADAMAGQNRVDVAAELILLGRGVYGEMAQLRVLLHGKPSRRSAVLAGHDADEPLFEQVPAAKPGGDGILAAQLEVDLTILKGLDPLRWQLLNPNVDAGGLLREQRHQTRQQIESQIVRGDDSEQTLAGAGVEVLMVKE